MSHHPRGASDEIDPDAELARLEWLVDEADGHERARALTSLALALRARGRVDEAADRAAQAAVAFNAVGDDRAGVLAERLHARLLVDIGAPEEAMHVLQGVRPRAEAAGFDAADVAACDEQLADTLRRVGEMASALDHLEAAGLRYRDAGRVLRSTVCLHDSGVVLAWMGRHREAMARLDAARKGFLRLRQRREVAVTSFNEGLVLDEQGRPDDAVQRFQDARSVFLAESALVDAASCDQNIGVVFIESGRLAEAVGRFEAAAAGFETAGQRRLAAMCLWNLGEALDALGRTAEARAARAAAAEHGIVAGP